MKRGFLNDKTKKPKPPVAPVQVHSSQKVFAHPHCRYDTPGASPQADDEFKCTMMPPPPPHPLLFQQSGPYSLCVFQGRLQELAILSTPGFPCALPSSTPTKYRVVNPDPDSANGGAGPGGMFASCKINTGDLVVAERPLFLIPAVAFGVPLNMPPGLQASSAQVMQLQMRQYNMLLEKCLDRLPDEEKQAFYAFKTHGRKEGLGPILDRMEMNALSVVINSADGKERFRNAAIFKLVSRINHKCTPNAIWDFDVRSFSMQIRALCPLAKDEEITISYIDDSSLTRKERKVLLAKYGITCKCALCTK